MTSLLQISTADLALLLCGAVLGGLVQGVSGFAFGMVAMTVWAWGMDPLEATVLAVFGGLCGQVLSALISRRRATAAQLLPFLIGGLVGVPVGTHLLPFIDAAQFKLLLGAVLVVGCPLMMAAPRLQFAGTLGRVGDGVSGLAGGLMGGISGLTGVAPAIWCAIRGFDKSVSRELLQTFNMVVLTATLIALTWKGAVTVEMAPRLGVVAVAMIVPSMIGARIHQRLPDAVFRRVVLVLLTASGFALLVSGAATLPFLSYNY